MNLLLRMPLESKANEILHIGPNPPPLNSLRILTPRKRSQHIDRLILHYL